MADTIINTGNVLPEFEKRKTWETTTPGDESTTETVTQAPERVAAGAALEKAGADELAAAGEQKAQADLTAPIQRQGAQDAADVASRKAADSMAAVTSAADDIARARAYTQKRKAEYEAYGDATLFGHTDTKGEIVRGVALALGGLGDAIQRAAMVRVGRNPPTIDTVGEIIEGVLHQQREHIGRLKDSVLQARTGETDAIAARQQALADIDLRGAVMLGRAKSLMEARLAAMGKTPDQIAADSNIAAISAKIADKQAAHTAPLLDRLTQKTQESTVKSGGDQVQRAPTAKVGGSPTGATAEQSAALAKYIDEHPDASQGDMVGYAKNLGIPDAQGEVTRSTKLPEAERERTTVNMEGKPVMAPSTRSVGAVSDQVASTKRATEALDGLIASIRSGSAVGNAVSSHIPGSDLNARVNEATGLISQSMGLSPSDAKIKMDHAMSGTGGIGMLTGGAAESLQRIRDEIQKFGAAKVAGMTTPVRSSAPASSSDTNVSKPTPAKLPEQASDRAADIKAMRGFLVSPAARKDPAKRKQVYDTLKAMGEKF